MANMFAIQLYLFDNREKRMSKENRLNFIDRLYINRLTEANEIINSMGGISIDLDSTVFATEQLAINKFNSNHNQNKLVENLAESRYAMVSWLEELGIENPLEKAIQYWNSDDVLLETSASEGFLILLNYLHEQNINLSFVTSRPARTKNATLASLKRILPWVDDKKIYLSSNDEIDPDFKAKKIQELGVKFHIDDAYEDALKIIQQSESIVVFLYTQPWNENIVIDEKYKDRIIKINSELSSINKRFQIPRAIQLYLTMIDYIERHSLKNYIHKDNVAHY